VVSDFSDLAFPPKFLPTEKEASLVNNSKVSNESNKTRRIAMLQASEGPRRLLRPEGELVGRLLALLLVLCIWFLVPGRELEY